MLSSKEDEGEKLGEKSEREREEGVEGEVKIASDPLSLHLLSNSLNRRGGIAFNSCSNYFHDPRN